MRLDEENGRATGMEKEVLGKFATFQVMNFGRTSVVSFWLLPSVLGVETMGEVGVTKYN